DSMVFVGYASPRWEITGTTGFDLLNRKLRIEGLFDAKTGFYQLDGTERIRCQSRINCRAELDRTAPLWQQAAVVALRESGTTTQYGYIERADFLRLRGASDTYELPARAGHGGAGRPRPRQSLHLWRAAGRRMALRGHIRAAQRHGPAAVRPHPHVPGGAATRAQPRARRRPKPHRQAARLRAHAG